MPIIPYAAGSEFAERIASIISDSQVGSEVDVSIRQGCQMITVSRAGAKVVLLVGRGDARGKSIVRIGFRDGMFRRLFCGDRSSELAMQIEFLLQTAPGSDIVEE